MSDRRGASALRSDLHLHEDFGLDLGLGEPAGHKRAEHVWLYLPIGAKPVGCCLLRNPGRPPLASLADRCRRGARWTYALTRPIPYMSFSEGSIHRSSGEPMRCNIQGRTLARMMLGI